MRFLQKVKDGGDQSNVDAYVLIEIKSLFSVMLLKFNRGHRENFHSHAFNAITVPLGGGYLIEYFTDKQPRVYKDWLPKITRRQCLHRVLAVRDSWAVTFRGPWKDTWLEQTPEGEVITLTHGRKVL